MKTLRSAIALGISASLILLSPGGRAWAQFAEVGRAAAPASLPAAAGASAFSGAAAPSVPTGAPSLSAPSLVPSISVPSVLPSFVPSAAPSASPAPHVPVSAAPALSVVPAASVPSASAAAPTAAKAAVSASAKAPAASALAGLRRELPDFSKLGAGESREAAADDFLSRVGELVRPAPALSAVPAAADGASRATLSKSRRGTPDSDVDGDGRPVKDGGLDELGNQRRTGGEGGPDERTSPDEGGRGGDSSGLFAALPILGLTLAAGAGIVSQLAVLPLLLVSMVLHEIGHAKAAARLGDPTATLQGRASFNPLTWWRHVDPMMSIVVPLVTFLIGGFIFGGAKPVPVEARYFKSPVKDMALVAFAGPAVNLGLAGLGALAYAGAVAMGLGAPALGVLTAFVFVNALLAIFNLIPIHPLDGSHILRAALPRSVSDRLDSVYAKLGPYGMLMAVWLAAILGGGAIFGAAAALTHLLLGLSFAAFGVQAAGSFLPAVAAIGMLLGSLKPAAAPVPLAPASSAAAAERPVELVVLFSGERAVRKDFHLTAVDPAQPNYVAAYQAAQQSLLGELSSAGLSPDALASYGATPIASYRRINAATIRLDSAKAAEFEAMLKARGDKVYPNERRKIITPVPVSPEDADPSARSPVTMAENLKITRADSVQAVAEKRWGKPDLNPWRRALRRLLGKDEAPQPKLAVVDSGADVSHPLLKRVKEVKNMTSGENVDDIGHGSWVTSMVLHYAPWAKNVTHYKTFLNGGATLDDILKSLNTAANDGNLVISNSWGSDDGDPESPDSQLVKKLASEGRVLVFAAGNAGPGKNTIGSPAIVQYKDAKTGAIRVVAVAATDRAKKAAYFSSRGPGSPKTAGKDGFAHRPDLAAVGYNTEGAWPAALGDADRTDGENGPLKAISGTSMSTPSVDGAIALLAMLFGVVEPGPKLDAVVVAVMSTLEKTGKNDYDSEGEGFLNVEAAYELLYKKLYPGEVPPTAVARYRAAVAGERSIEDYLDPSSEANVVAGYPDVAVANAMLGELKSARARKAALEAEWPGIAHAAKGAVGRAWARLIGRAPVDPRVAEYRRLRGVVAADDEARSAFYREVSGMPGYVRDELLEGYEETLERHARHREEYSAFVAANPGVEYRAAGAIGRLIMRLTGRGPKS